MTVIIKIGRRVPISLRSRVVNSIKGLIGFQENIWMMIKMSLNKSKRMYDSGSKKPKGHMECFDIDKQATERDGNDAFWRLQWMIITIKGDEACETAEYDEAQNMYGALKGILRKYDKEKMSSPKLASVFKTKMLSDDKIKEAYGKGLQARGDKDIASVLLEMGILTHIDWIKDFDERKGMLDITG